MKDRDQKLIWEAYVAENTGDLSTLIEREFRDLQREMGLGFEMYLSREKIASLIAKRSAFSNLPVEDKIMEWLHSKNIGR